MQSSHRASRSRPRPHTFGRIRFGRQQLPAIVPAIPLGIAAAAGFAIGATQLGFASEHPVVGALILGSAVSGPFVALAWVLFVDRATLAGAPARPGETVESSWYNKATQGAFHDILVVVGVATTVLSVTPLDVAGSQALLGVLLLCCVSVGVRYLIHRRRDRSCATP